MNATVDLRTTYGWHLSAHVRRQAAERGVTARQILETIADPEIRYSAENYGPGRWVYKRGDITVVGVPSTKTIVTVLWNTVAEWTSRQFREHLDHARHPRS